MARLRVPGKTFFLSKVFVAFSAAFLCTIERIFLLFLGVFPGQRLRSRANAKLWFSAQTISSRFEFPRFKRFLFYDLLTSSIRSTMPDFSYLSKSMTKTDEPRLSTKYMNLHE